MGDSKGDVLSIFRDFLENGRFLKSLNSKFIVMVPKKGGAEDFKDYRPISLVGSLYNLIAEVLAIRLKTVMGSLVAKAPNAFMEVRQILDTSLIANPEDQIVYLGWVLLCFDALSGLRINLEKSLIFPVGDVGVIDLLAMELGCNVGSLHLSRSPFRGKA